MNKIPKYQYIIRDLKEKIKSNKYKIDEKLPTEQELAKKYNVSRMTVNKALSTLEQNSLIYKIQGSGTFVKKNTIDKKFGSSISFSDDIKSSKGRPGSVLLEYKLIDPANCTILANKFNLSENNKIIYFKRLRLADNEKVAISHTYISNKVIPYIKMEVLEKSFYEYLESEYGISPICSNYIVSAEIPNDEQIKLLDISSEALLKVSHYSYTKNGEAFEYNETFYLGTKFTYTTEKDTIRLN